MLINELVLLYYALWLDGKTLASNFSTNEKQNIWTNRDSHVHLPMLCTSWLKFIWIDCFCVLVSFCRVKRRSWFDKWKQKLVFCGGTGLMPFWCRFASFSGPCRFIRSDRIFLGGMLSTNYTNASLRRLKYGEKSLRSAYRKCRQCAGLEGKRARFLRDKLLGLLCSLANGVSRDNDSPMVEKIKSEDIVEENRTLGGILFTQSKATHCRLRVKILYCQTIRDSFSKSKEEKWIFYAPLKYA